ncbi:hypothetical protein HK405_011201 [Cladochytrium tenue]|nr:hypothetical protein HK405_011201 [Cladochytrium tenue]
MSSSACDGGGDGCASALATGLSGLANGSASAKLSISDANYTSTVGLIGLLVFGAFLIVGSIVAGFYVSWRLRAANAFKAGEPDRQMPVPPLPQHQAAQAAPSGTFQMPTTYRDLRRPTSMGSDQPLNAGYYGSGGNYQMTATPSSNSSYGGDTSSFPVAPDRAAQAYTPQTQSVPFPSAQAQPVQYTFGASSDSGDMTQMAYGNGHQMDRGNGSYPTASYYGNPTQTSQPAQYAVNQPSVGTYGAANQTVVGAYGAASASAYAGGSARSAAVSPYAQTNSSIRSSAPSERRPANISDWSMNQVVAWAIETGLGNDAAIKFASNNISGASLVALSAEDMSAMGLTALQQTAVRFAIQRHIS